MKPIRVEDLTNAQLSNLITNHRRKGATDAQNFLQALAERQRRKGGGLVFATSFKIIVNAAKDGRFLSYKELADASGVDWGRAHYAIGQHLWDLVEYAHWKQWPMLSAIVVNKRHVQKGGMEPETLKGFIGAARELDLIAAGENEIAFLRRQQARVFAWARGDRGPEQKPALSHASDQG
jgi:hypothetical protein